MFLYNHLRGRCTIIIIFLVVDSPCRRVMYSLLLSTLVDDTIFVLSLTYSSTTCLFSSSVSSSTSLSTTRVFSLFLLSSTPSSTTHVLSCCRHSCRHISCFSCCRHCCRHIIVFVVVSSLINDFWSFGVVDTSRRRLATF